MPQLHLFNLTGKETVGFHYDALLWMGKGSSNL